MRLANLIAALTLPAGWQAAGQQSLDQILSRGVVVPNAKASAPAKQRPAPSAQQPRSVPPAGSGDIAGLQTDLPPGWHARLSENGAVVATSQNDLVVVIAPVPDAGDTLAGAWLQSRGAPTLTRYIKEPVITGIYPSGMGPRAALASFGFGGASAPATASVLCLMSGGAGTLYVIAGPRATFLRERPALVRILQNLAFTSKRAAGAQTGFTRFQDPKQGAFTVDVPAGWKVDGGTLQSSPFNTRSFVWVTSPDGSTVIRLRDPAFSSVPNRQRSEPGPEFARQYAARLAADLHASNLQFTAVTPRQDLSNSTSTPGVGRSQTTSGEADFTCIRNGQPCAGKVIAVTRAATLSPGFGMWSVLYLVSYVTAQDRTGVTESVFQHMLDSVDCPQRFGMQLPVTRTTLQSVRDAAQYAAKVFDRAHRNREESGERVRQSPDFTELEQIPSPR